MRERAERFAVAVAMAVVLVGAAAIALTTPGYTRELMLRTGGPERSGLPESVAIETAEEVRHYVVGRSPDALPTVVAGRPGFDNRAVGHLDDVRRVFGGARLATSLAAGALAIWLAWCLAYRRSSALESGLSAGSYVTAGIVLLVAAVGLLDFDRFFSAFHGVFFESGTWTFDYDDLLVQLFPERFWAISASALGMLVLLGAAALLGASRLVRRSLAYASGTKA